jgi:hypothetical protein
MVSVDLELALVGLVAMLEPATLASSVLALVLGERPLRTGSLFYLGGLGATVAVGALVMLLIAPRRTMPMLVVARRWIERHARTVAMIIVAVLAASLLRNGISGLTS